MYKTRLSEHDSVDEMNGRRAVKSINLVTQAIRQPEDGIELRTTSTREIHIELHRANATKTLQGGSAEPTSASLWVSIDNLADTAWSGFQGWLTLVMKNPAN